MRTAPLDASGQAQLTYVESCRSTTTSCARNMSATACIRPASAGPVDLAVIKGFLLPPPAVNAGGAGAGGALGEDGRARSRSSARMRSHVPTGSVRMRVADSEIASAKLVNGSRRDLRRACRRWAP